MLILIPIQKETNLKCSQANIDISMALKTKQDPIFLNKQFFTDSYETHVNITDEELFNYLTKIFDSFHVGRNIQKRRIVILLVQFRREQHVLSSSCSRENKRTYMRLCLLDYWKPKFRTIENKMKQHIMRQIKETYLTKNSCENS